jgi:hypothetical protein
MESVQKIVLLLSTTITVIVCENASYFRNVAEPQSHMEPYHFLFSRLHNTIAPTTPAPLDLTFTINIFVKMALYHCNH